MATLPPPLPRAGRLKTRIIVVVWTLLSLTVGMYVGARLGGPRIIQVERSDGPLRPLHPLLIHPVVRCEQTCR
jgi:hypothetical protein